MNYVIFVLTIIITLSIINYQIEYIYTKCILNILNIILVTIIYYNNYITILMKHS